MGDMIMTEQAYHDNKIIVQLTTDNYIIVRHKPTGYYGKFHQSEIDKYIRLLLKAEEVEEYDEDNDYTPDEVDISYPSWDFSIDFEHEYSGNYVPQWNIETIINCVKDFSQKYIREMNIDYLKSLDNFDNFDISQLLLIKSIIDTNKEAV